MIDRLKLSSRLSILDKPRCRLAVGESCTSLYHGMNSTKCPYFATDSEALLRAIVMLSSYRSR